MTTPVNPILAKLLKEKGFDRYSAMGYTKKGDKYWHQGGQEPVKNGEEYYEGREYDGDLFFCAAPTIAEVVMWLYKNHGIWIYPFRHDFNNEFYWHIDTPHEDEFTSDMNFNSLTEAYKAGIEYCLTNLI